MTGAIVIAATDSQLHRDGLNVVTASDGWDAWQGCVASIPVLGCSAIARTVESMKCAGTSEISVFSTSVRSRKDGIIPNEEQAWRAATDALRVGQERGLDAVLIMRSGPYIECEWPSLLEQHREYGEAVTRAVDREGPLDLWVVDPDRFCVDGDLLLALRAAKAAEFAVEGYVNPLQGARDLRRWAIDILSARCQARPQGTEVRPGLWMAAGTQIGRSARIVAPAYIGCGVKISDDCLITRCSTVEANSHVDFGTAIEDSSVLPDTYVGIGLDLSYSVVDGSEILNLHHEVRLRISDPVVLRRHSPRVQDESEPVFETKEMALSSIEKQ